ncbi:hypothetical protein [Brevibacterium atlanticum]|uniref:hypothetical protein n=1 Tax=Brevibacterium atlanticum TaxID=2697563 RepID=UPI001423C5EC|nr:hypothetical protein [Brevibacterium atlanticum]
MPLCGIEIDRVADSLTVAWSLPSAPAHVWRHLQDVASLDEWLGRPLVFSTEVGGEIIIDHADSYLCRSEILTIGDLAVEATWSFPDEPATRIAIQLTEVTDEEVTEAAGSASTEVAAEASDDAVTEAATETGAPARDDAESTTTLALRHDGLGALIGSYATGWCTHLTFFEASLAKVPIPGSQFWPLCATFDQLLAPHAESPKE